MEKYKIWGPRTSTPFVATGSGTLGPWKSVLRFLNDLGSLLIESTEEGREVSSLFQRLTIAFLRGNASYIIGSRPSLKIWRKLTCNINLCHFIGFSQLFLLIK